MKKIVCRMIDSRMIIKRDLVSWVVGGLDRQERIMNAKC